MGSDNEKSMTRTQLADLLDSLSKQLRSGALDLQGRAWTIPDELSAKIALKEKKGRMVAKLKWEWSTLGEYEPALKQEVETWRESLKQVKKRLTSSFGELRRSVEASDIPSQNAIAAFEESSRAFAGFADPEWEEAMQEFLAHFQNFKLAVRSGQNELMSHELQDLANRMKECHRAFK